MPFYDYECPNCGTRVELLRPFGEINDPVTCVKCGGACKIGVSVPSPFTTGPARSNRAASKDTRV